jgi:hypothetical protein
MRIPDVNTARQILEDIYTGNTVYPLISARAHHVLNEMYSNGLKFFFIASEILCISSQYIGDAS